MNDKEIQSEKNDKQKGATGTFYKIPEDSLHFYTYQVQPDAHPKKSNLNHLPNKWIGLSKNSIGFFIYHKGKNYYSTLTIENDTMTNGGYGEHISWPIRQLTKISDQEYHLELGTDTVNKPYATSQIEIVGQDTLFAIQTTKIFDKTQTGERLLREYTGLYIPAFQKHLLPHIDEPNKKSPASWIHFEEIDLEEFKKEKTCCNI